MHRRYTRELIHENKRLGGVSNCFPHRVDIIVDSLGSPAALEATTEFQGLAHGSQKLGEDSAKTNVQTRIEKGVPNTPPHPTRRRQPSPCPSDLEGGWEHTRDHLQGWRIKWEDRGSAVKLKVMKIGSQSDVKSGKHDALAIGHN